MSILVSSLQNTTSISAIQGGSRTDWTHTKGTQQCNISMSAIVTPQNANHYSLTQGQVNILPAFIVQLVVIFMQQFHGVIPASERGNYNKRVTKGVLFL